MNSILNNKALFEYFGEEPREEVVDADPYEAIKKMVAYDRLVDLRSRLEYLKDPDAEINEIIDYISVIIQFFDGYSLPEVTNLVNNLIDVISKNWDIKVPDALPPEPVPEEPVESQPSPEPQQPQQQQFAATPRQQSSNQQQYGQPQQ
jgi:hypothetical protein